MYRIRYLTSLLFYFIQTFSSPVHFINDESLIAELNTENFDEKMKQHVYIFVEFCKLYQISLLNLNIGFNFLL